MAETTDVFGWTMPDQNTGTNWDATLNTLFDDDIEGTVNTVKTTADAALARAGGTMTGDVKTFTVTETGVNLGATMSGTVDIDLDTANNFYGTATGAVTFTISNPPASGTYQRFEVEITNGGLSGVTWPAAVVFESTPTYQSAGVDIVTLYTRDGGTTYRAVQSYSA